MKKKSLALTLMILMLLVAPFFCGCNEVVTNHTIEVASSNIQYGRVSGDGVYKNGTAVTLIATPNTGCAFVAWIRNNVKLTDQVTYTFEANETTEGKYVAVFKGAVANYYQLSNFGIEFKNLTQNDVENQIFIKGITLKLTMLNSNNIQTVYDNSEFNIEVLSNEQTSDTLAIESDYYMGTLKNYYVDGQIRYTINTESGIINKTMVLDFLNVSYNTDDNGNTYAQTSMSFVNNSINVLMLIVLYPAGVTPEANIISWN